MLCLSGVSSTDMKNILDFIYNGEIQIYQDNLDQFLTIAQRFKLDGLLQEKEENIPANRQFEEDLKGFHFMFPSQEGRVLASLFLTNYAAKYSQIYKKFVSHHHHEFTEK